MKKHSAESICNINRLAVKSILAGKDLTISDLARELGISVQYMHELLNGTRNPKNYATRIAQTLGVPLETIILKPEKSSLGHAA